MIPLFNLIEIFSTFGTEHLPNVPTDKFLENIALTLKNSSTKTIVKLRVFKYI